MKPPGWMRSLLERGSPVEQLPQIPSPSQLNLRTPSGYIAREKPELFFDAPTGVVYQPHVYELANFLVAKSGVTRVIDIGCGSGQKLIPFKEVDLICVDHPNSESLLREHLPSADFIACDLEIGLPDLSSLAENSVIICADVLEHLVTPHHLFSALTSLSKIASYVLISTPDRNRARGLLASGPPQNPAHVREWSADEFGRLLIDFGVSQNFLLGHSINNSRDMSKGTILAIAGREAEFRIMECELRVCAILHCYNECDIIESTISHLLREGVDVHVFDNWSNDGTYEVLKNLESKAQNLVVSRFPEKQEEYSDWAAILFHTSEYADTLDADWVIFYDADEIRISPWQGVTLKEAISFVDKLGYNAVDFTIVNFHFTDRDIEKPDVFQPNSLRFFDFGRHPSHLVQVKAWKKSQATVNLASNAGHDAAFEGRKVFPLKFLTKHYPMRSSYQANKKVYMDRLPRWQEEKNLRGWHNHYDTYKEVPEILPWKTFELINYDDNMFNSEYIVERLSGIGVETEMRAIPNIESRLKAK